MSGRVDSTSHAAAIARVNQAIKFAPELREHLEERGQAYVLRVASSFLLAPGTRMTCAEAVKKLLSGHVLPGRRG